MVFLPQMSLYGTSLMPLATQDPFGSFMAATQLNVVMLSLILAMMQQGLTTLQSWNFMLQVLARIKALCPLGVKQAGMRHLLVSISGQLSGTTAHCREMVQFS